MHMFLPLHGITETKFIKDLYFIDLKVSNCKQIISEYKRNYPGWISSSHDLRNI